VFYGWILVGTAFVTMGIVVNARTAFSLFYPSILDEFGWSRALTAATFTTGLLASNAFTPFLGVLMDRLGPRVVFSTGLGLMSLGLALATMARAPWHLHLTLGVLVAGASVFVSYMGHSLLLPNWFVRKRGLALGVAFSGVGVGSFLLLPWLQGLIGRVGWRGACWTLVALVALVVLPLNAIVPRRRPQEMGLLPDGDEAAGRPGARPAPEHVVDRAWAATEWTLARAVRTTRFWWVFVGYFTGLFAW
jgi:MFS family permease